MDLKVNIQKTKVMIFNKSGRVLKGYNFSLEEQSLELVSEYKYLGIIFKPSGSFHLLLIICQRKPLRQCSVFTKHYIQKN